MPYPKKRPKIINESQTSNGIEFTLRQCIQDNIFDCGDCEKNKDDYHCYPKRRFEMDYGRKYLQACCFELTVENHTNQDFIINLDNFRMTDTGGYSFYKFFISACPKLENTKTENEGLLPRTLDVSPGEKRDFCIYCPSIKGADKIARLEYNSDNSRVCGAEEQQCSILFRIRPTNREIKLQREQENNLDNMTKEQYLQLAKEIRVPFLQLKNNIFKNIQEMAAQLTTNKLSGNLPTLFEDECILIFCRFAAVDGVVDEDETAFINAVFERNFSRDFIRENAVGGPVDYTKEAALSLQLAVQTDNVLLAAMNYKGPSAARTLYGFLINCINVLVNIGGVHEFETQAFSQFRELQTAYINENDRLIKNKLPSTYPLPEESEDQIDESATIHSDVNIQQTSTDNSDGKEQDAKSSSMEELLQELDGLIGLSEIKKDVHTMTNFIRISNIRKERGMKVPAISRHLVFTGNPGTGKTTVARLVAQLYQRLGVLSKGQLVETDRGGLVAGYLGQTALKTQEVIRQALGGVLFIDEAYALVNRDDDSYGKEAIETLLKAMEDHRDELVIIVAGYPELMHKFMESNPGLASRFNKYFDFPDYTGEELMRIFERFCQQNGYKLEPEAAELISARLKEMYASRSIHFGNARTVRNIFEKAINAQADRLASLSNPENAELETLTKEDILAAI